MKSTHPFHGAGSFDRIILIQRQKDQQAQDAYGEPVPTAGQTADGWVTIRTCYASLRPLGDDERFAANQRLGESDMSFLIRYPLDLPPDSPAALNLQDTVLWEGKRFDITALNEFGRKEHLQITGRLRAGEAG